MFVPADLVRALAVVVAHPFTTLWILLLAFLVRKGTTLAHTSNYMPQHCLVALRVCRQVCPNAHAQKLRAHTHAWWHDDAQIIAAASLIIPLVRAGRSQRTPDYPEEAYYPSGHEYDTPCQNPQLS